jgi:formiminotetrahydrofolate cyclodeaminase
MTEDISGGIASLTLSALFDQASSIAPVPGGGCVSAVCGYLALSILLKSIRISAKSHPDDVTLSGVDRQLATLANQLLNFAQADSDSFDGYMRALKLPKTNGDEIALRQKAIHEAAVGATVAALNILDAGNQVLDIAYQVQGRVSASVRADERSAVELVSAMVSTAEWECSVKPRYARR